MVDLIRYAQYVTLRDNMREPAHYVGYWLKEREKKRTWLHEDRVDPSQSHWVAVPGLGFMCFSMEYDNDHNEWDTDNIEHEWRSRETCDPIRTGKHLGDGWYALNHFDGGRFLAVRPKEGGDYETRRSYYSSLGMSKSDADIRARHALQQECKYWYEVAQGDRTWVGWIVTLYDTLYADDSCKELASDSCWGYDMADIKYIHDCMDDSARELVLAQYELKHNLKGITNDHITQALPAWRTAMTSSDDDREIADPVFVSTVREKTCQKSLCL